MSDSTRTSTVGANGVAVRHRPDGTGTVHDGIDKTIDAAIQLAEETGRHSRKDKDRA
jgi:hypothetical protein